MTPEPAFGKLKAEGDLMQIISALTMLVLTATQPQSDNEPDTSQPVKMDAPIRAVHVPGFLDNNDVAQFMIEVEFPNSCYALGRLVVRARTEDLQDGQIPFQLEALKFNRPVCIQVKTKTLKVVDVGILPAGSYKLVGLKDERVYNTLRIGKAENRAVDNYTYAPVDALFVRNNLDGHRRVVVLVGSYRNACMKMKAEVPVYRANETTRVIEILPIVEMEKDKMCLEQIVPFMVPVEIPEKIPSGEYVFHVRTMNGNSLNKLDTIQTE
jgi:hypothetical protein